MRMESDEQGARLGPSSTATGSDSPAWFQRALATPRQSETVTVHGTVVAFRSWGPANADAIVLIHGGGAHGGWWDHIGPWFADSHHVVAVDLSGHGDSGHRRDYSIETWADEVRGVIDEVTARPPLLVGHSMGGFVAITAAAQAGQQVHGVVAVDSPISAAPSKGLMTALRRAADLRTFYTSLDDVVARFRTVPRQAQYLRFVVEHIARQSVRKGDHGWGWKYDGRVFSHLDPGGGKPVLDQLRAVGDQFALLVAEHGLVTPTVMRAVHEATGHAARVARLPDSGHHPMLDQPLVLVASLEALLARWA